MKRYFRRFWITVLVIFLLMNLVAAYHAYKFTHFTKAAPHVQVKPENLGFFEKVTVLIKGKDFPWPEKDTIPAKKYERVILQGRKGKIVSWFFSKEHAKGTVILFHGYGSEKSTSLAPAATFDSLGYQTFLVDFEGYGESDGNNTSIGYYEAANVKTVFDYCRKRDSNIILFGSSMGASAIIRAISAYHVNPSKIILECPYGSMADAAKNRFKTMGIPTFPMADLLVFWGGIENGFWAFSNNCVEYAKDVKCPTLLMRGLDDRYVSPEEVHGIYENVTGPKKLHHFAGTAHESYCLKDHAAWVNQVHSFLDE